MSSSSDQANGASSVDHIHRLVQDENAKTILLNVPLEVSVQGESDLVRHK